MQHGRATHIKEHETKYNELVQRRLKVSHCLPKSQQAHKINSRLPTLVPTILGGNVVFNQYKGQNKKYL